MTARYNFGSGLAQQRAADELIVHPPADEQQLGREVEETPQVLLSHNYALLGVRPCVEALPSHRRSCLCVPLFVADVDLDHGVRPHLAARAW